MQKEVKHLRGLVNTDSSSVMESPGILKVDGSQGFSPLTFDKRLSQVKFCES
jgi:hypothetical protein